jgi:hypothetical protein
MRGPVVRMQRARHGGQRVLSLILDLFTLDSVGIHVVDRRKADSLPASCIYSFHHWESFGRVFITLGCEMRQQSVAVAGSHNPVAFMCLATQG